MERLHRISGVLLGGTLLCLTVIYECRGAAEAAPSTNHVDPLDPALVDLSRCGPLALQVCAVFLGRETSHDEIGRLLPPDGSQRSLLELKRAAEDLGLETLALRWNRELPRTIRTPAILPVEMHSGHPHFLAMLGRRGEQVCLVDVPHAPHWIDVEELKTEWRWRGEALHLATDAEMFEELRGAQTSSGVFRVVGFGALGLLVAVILWRGRPRLTDLRRRRVAGRRENGIS